MAFIDVVTSLNKQIVGALPDIRPKGGLVEFPHISTGSFVIDYVTGIGGIPRGRITELHGLQSSGKTTSALMTAAECQAMGLGVLYLDFEHSIDPTYAQMLGVSLDPTLWAINQPDSMESGLRIAHYFMEQSKGSCGMIIADSVAAMATIQDKAHEIGETQIGTQAQVMSLALRQLKHDISDSGVAFVFINQLRDVIDLSWAGQQRAKGGPQYTTPGGRALKFYADMRLEFIPTGQEKQEQDLLFGGDPKTGKGKVVIGQRARVTAVKNKCAAPFRSSEIFLRHGKGVDSTVPCVELAIKFGIIPVRSGGYHVIPSPYCDDSVMEQSIHGKENVIAYFELNQDKLGAMFQVVWKTLLNKEQ